MDFSSSTDGNCPSESDVSPAAFLVYDCVSIGQSYSKSLYNKLLSRSCPKHKEFLCLVVLQFLFGRLKLNTALTGVAQWVGHRPTD